jgi:hypothetical protein
VNEPAGERRDVPPDAWRVERWLAPFFTDSGLWPVTAVVIAHAVLGIALLLLDAIRSPGAFSLAALAALALVSLEALRRAALRGRLGPLSATIAASWLLAALAAWAADRAGLY